MRVTGSMKPLASMVLLAWLGFAVPQARSTSIPDLSLEEIVAQSDHVVVAKVARVDMVDGLGRQVRDRDGRTGPGLHNRIRFHLEVGEALLTNCRRPPRRIVVPLWQMWHYSLGTMQDEVQGNVGIFLLKGANFEPAYSQGFQRGMAERSQIEALAQALRLRRKPAQVACKESPAAAAG